MLLLLVYWPVYCQGYQSILGPRVLAWLYVMLLELET
jgi:hypothetical protein